MEIKKLESALERGQYLLCVDDAFEWKDVVLEKYKGCEKVRILNDPDFLELYRMYEFSDKVIYIGESDQYGSLWNYVREGLITIEQALEAIMETGH